jgi:hypothetical protein
MALTRMATKHKKGMVIIPERTAHFLFAGIGIPKPPLIVT